MNFSGQRLMILGAGPHQLPLVRRAVELGCHVITVDYLPENVGHRLSHQYVNASTVDVPAILSAARQLRIEGITTFGSDPATPTVAAVAAALGLPGPPVAVARVMTDKGRFHEFQQVRGLDGPVSFALDEGEVLSELPAQPRAPVVVKPADASGSRGVVRLEQFDLDKLSVAAEQARQFSRTGRVCVESCVDGIHTSGDGLLCDGRFDLVLLTDKFRRGFVVTGHALPSGISQGDRQRILAEVERTCAALGYSDGPLDFDVVFTPERVAVIEMSPRLGGNGIAQLISRATGFDLLEANLYYALGKEIPPATAHQQIVQPCGSLIFGSSTAGRLREIVEESELRTRVPEVFDYYCGYRPGDGVEAFTHGGASLGHVLFDLPVAGSYQAMADRIGEVLGLEVDVHAGAPSCT